MNVFMTLLRKELLESWRDRKLIWLPIVMILFCVTQPVSSYYMPVILEKAGGLPDGAVLEIPEPTGVEVLQGVLSQLGIIGTAIFVLAVMGTIAQERNNGSLTLIMARPVQPIQYILSKWFASGIILVFSFAIGYAVSYYYTNLLFEPVKIGLFIASFLVYIIWILFVLSITIFAGVLLNKVGGIAGLSLLVIASLSLLTSLLSKYLKWSPANTEKEVGHLLTTGELSDTFPYMLGTTSLIIIVTLALTIWSFKRLEKY